MVKISIKFLLLLTLIDGIVFSVCTPLLASSKDELDFRNIAYKKKYTLEPSPNYINCTDEKDTEQLTDGVFSKGYFWVQTSTIGWKLVNPVTITIDLDEVKLISGISFSTAAGSAGVHWPRSIFVFLSNNGVDYSYECDLKGLGNNRNCPEHNQYSIFQFAAYHLRSQGRFVKLIIVPKGSFIFVDEVQIYEGSQPPLKRAGKIYKVSELGTVTTHFLMKKAISRRLERDLEAVRDTIGELQNRQTIEKRLNAIKKEIQTVTDTIPKDFKTIFPINNLHQRIFETQASIWSAKGFNLITLWQKNRWDMVAPSELINTAAPRVVVKMMQDEERNAAFNVTNTGNKLVQLKLRITGLPGGTDPNWIKVHNGVFTDSAEGTPVMAALPRVEKGAGGYMLELLPGITQQIWLSFYSGGLEAGEYGGEVIISPGEMKVPINLTIYPLSYPKQQRLHLCGWDYTNEKEVFDVTQENRAALVLQLKTHKVDTPWARTVLATGKYDKDANMIRYPDTSNFESWIKLWPSAQNYFVFVAARKTFCGFEMGSPNFNKAVGAWIDFWIKKIGSWGISANRLGILIVDEPHTIEQSEVVIQYAQAIKKMHPEVTIFEDVTWREPWKAPAALFSQSDILCINLASQWIGATKQFKDFYIAQRNSGRKIWLYSCYGPARQLDPYAYFRLQSWFAWELGALGSCFWAFGDSNGSSSWNEYLARTIGAYTPLFLDSTSVTLGKHMVAIREGVQDYEYLGMLRDRIDELEKIANETEELVSAKNLLDSAAARVIAGIDDRDKLKWSVSKDRSVADAVREEILEALVQLNNF